jgi:3-hydroxyisobutyrate dehydrogenase-like beta-hydroxyacid dehydrogenase
MPPHEFEAAMPTAAPVVGILSGGQMGASIGGVLRQFGQLDVLCALDGRSDETRRRCEQAGLRDVGSIASLTKSADIILSMLPALAAAQVASSVAEAIDPECHPIYVDCNAIAPELAVRINAEIEASGGRFVDAAIQSAPPREPGAIIYASGPNATLLSVLDAYGLDIRVLGGPVGQASAVDLVLGGMVKIFEAAGIEILLAARRWQLHDLLKERVPVLLDAIEPFAPLMPSRVKRWESEMHETAHFMQSLGLPGDLFTGAAKIFELIARSEHVCAGDTAWPRTHKEILDIIAGDLERAGHMPKD